MRDTPRLVASQCSLRLPATLGPRSLELPRFRRHLDASGGKPGKVRFGCRGRGRRIRRSSVARRSGSPCWATSLSVSWPRIWGSPTSRCAIGLKQERAERGERPGGLSQDEREELKRLRDENARLRMEREILSKAAVFFAKESDGR